VTGSSVWPHRGATAPPGAPVETGSIDETILLRRLPDLICLIDAAAVIRWANRDGLVDQPFTDFIAVEDRPRLLALLRQPTPASHTFQAPPTLSGTILVWFNQQPDSDLFLVRASFVDPRDRRDLAVMLHDVASAIAPTLDLDEVLRLIGAGLRRFLYYDGIALLLLDGNRLRRCVIGGRAEGSVGEPDQSELVRLANIQNLILNRRSILLPDTRADPDWKTLKGFEYVRSWMGVPLLAPRRDRLIGILALDQVQPNAFTDDDMRLVEILAEQVSVSIDNARLYEETRWRADHLAALNEVAATVSQSLDLQQTLHTALDKALDVVGVDAGAISLVDESAGELVIRAHRGWRQADLARRTRVRLGEGLSGRAAVTGEVVVTGDVRGDPRLAVPQFAEEGVQAMALVPMRARGRVVGILGVMHYTPYTFSPDSIDFLKALADQIGVAIDNARLYEAEYTRRRTSEALREISGALASTLDLDQAFNVTLQHLAEVVQYDRASIVLLDGDSVRMRAAHGFGAVDALLQTPMRLRPGSPLGRIVRERRPLIIPDESAYSEWSIVADRSEMKSWLGAPLVARLAPRAIGALMVESRTPRAYGEEDANTLFTLANHLATAVENARLFEAEIQRSTQMALINEIAQRTSSTLDLGELLNRAATLIHGRLGYRAVALFLINPQDGAIDLISAAGDWVELIGTGYREPLDHGSIGRAAQSGQPILHNDVSTDADYSPLVEGEIRSGSQMILPLARGGAAIGALVVRHERAHHFQPSVVEVAHTLADQLSIAIENARLYQEVARRVYELGALHEMAVAGASARDFKEVSARMVEVLQRTLDLEYLALFLIDSAGKSLEPYAVSTREEEALRKHRIGMGWGIIGAAAQSGHIVNVGDTLRDARYLPSIPGVRSELAVPLTVGERVIGVIDAQSTRVGAFAQGDERMLLTVAGQLAVTLEKARLYQAMEQRLGEMSTLQTFAQKISMSLELSEVLDTIVIALKESLGCRGVSIALIQPETQTLEIRAAAGIKAKWKREAKLKLGEGISGKVARTAQPMYVADAQAVPDFIFFDPEVRSLLCVPLTIKERVIGTLTIDQTVPDAFTPEDERVLAIAAAQAAVAIENAQLYEELKERARKLEQAYHELQESDRIKDELVQNVSHELRTPLTFVKGYVELMLEGDMGPLTERQRESLTIVAEKANTVTRLVSDIIFLEQIERESLQLSHFQLADLARLALQGGEVTAAAAGIHLSLDVEPNLPPVRGDRDRLAQVFDNLLANAIKFSPQGGLITIRLRDGLTAGQGDTILASVSDTGIGIPRNQLNRIFERFYQVDGSATRRFGGAGVGLAIVKRILEAHGGTIWAESEVSRGSTFLFTVPKAKPIEIGRLS